MNCNRLLYKELRLIALAVMNPISKLSISLFLLLAVASCTVKKHNQPSGPDDWLQGNDEDKFDVVARQLRGFDMAMVETGYRYQELYWAGVDQNWEYAQYQVEKIKVAIENGLQRRPKRAASADSFLTDALPTIEKIVKRQDSTAFLQGIQVLAANCNACHNKENVSFFTVNIPLARQSPIRK